MKYSRTNTVTREEYDARHRSEPTSTRVRKLKPDRLRGRDPIRDDDLVAKYAVERPHILSGWLERVEGRFMGAPVDITPEDALKMALRITAGEVRYCDAQIARLSEDELFERPEKTVYAEMPSGGFEMVEERRDAEIISRWQQLRRDAMDRMTRYAKMAIEVGLEERDQQMREDQANVIVRFMEAVMSGIELTADQRKMLGPVMRRELEVLESTAVDVP